MASLALVTLLVVELLGVTLWFDSRSLDTAASPWLRLIADSPQYLRVTITAGVVLLLLWRALQSRRDTPDSGSGDPTRSRRAFWVTLHACAFAAFVDVSSAVFAADADALWQPALWVSAWFAAAGLMLAAWAMALAPQLGRALAERRGRLLAGAAAVLGAAAWWSGVLTGWLWAPLAQATFSVVSAMLAAIYPEVIARADRLILGTPEFKVHIAASCSGYEGIGLVITFLSIYLWLFRRELRFPAALLLLPIGALAIWCVNAVRIAALVVIGHSGWPEIALGGFHSQAGWIAFNLVGLAIVWLINRGQYFARQRPPRRHERAADATTAYLAPLLVVMACAMVTGALSSGLDWLYPIRVIAAAVMLWMFRHQYRPLGWSVSWHAVAIGAATFLLWIALVPAAPAGEPWPAALASVPMHWAAAWMVLRIVGYAVTVPLVEELAFRGYLMRRLVREDFERLPLGLFTWSSFLISSLLFGALHGGLWLAGTLAGMTFAVALYRRRTLGDAVVAHATTNGLIALYVLATGRWSVWS